MTTPEPGTPDPTPGPDRRTAVIAVVVVVAALVGLAVWVATGGSSDAPTAGNVPPLGEPSAPQSPPSVAAVPTPAPSRPATPSPSASATSGASPGRSATATPSAPTTVPTASTAPSTPTRSATPSAPASSPATTPARTPSPAPSADQPSDAAVDWNTVAYPVDCQGVGVDVQQVLRGTVAGRPGTTVLVRLRCASGAGNPPSALLAYAPPPAGTTPTLLGTLVPFERDLVLASASLRGGDVYATGSGYSSADVPRCCPDRPAALHWRWSGGAFVAVG